MQSALDLIPPNCPLCDFNLLNHLREQNGMTYFECPHCGNYKADIDTLNDCLSNKKKPELGHILSHTIRRINQTTGTKWVSINSDIIQQIIKTRSLPTPQEQAEYLLHWLGTNFTDPGLFITVTWETHGAIIGAKSSYGFEFIVSGLISEGLIIEGEVEFGKGQRVALTFKGWHKFEEIKRGVTTGSKAFMAMKYNDPEIDNMVDNYFRDAVKKTGFELKKLNDGPKAGLIDDNLRVEIRTSRFLIADLTSGNNGAYWEAGYAEGLGKPVIYTCEKKKFEQEKTHFDTKELSGNKLYIYWLSAI